MAQRLKGRIQMGLETTRGTAVTMTLELPSRDTPFGNTEQNHQAEIMGSSTFPYLTKSVPVGVTHDEIELVYDANKDTIRDAILLATKRTSGVLPSVTIITDQVGVGVARYTGCVCTSLALQMSRGATPGMENLLQIVQRFACMKGEAGAGAINTGLSAAWTRNFQMRHSSMLINNVAPAAWLNHALTIANSLALGPVDSANQRLYIGDGAETHEISHTARYATTAWRALLEAGTDAAINTIVYGTGTANETLTATIAKAQVLSRQLGDADGEATEQISIRPWYDGAAPVVWSFGSAIGATVLGL